MAKNVFSVLAGIVLLAMLAVLAYAAFFGRDSPLDREPSSWVENMTFAAYSDFLYDYEITRYASRAEVIAEIDESKNLTIGVVVDPDNLNFGRLPGHGSFVKRMINLENNVQREAQIFLKAYGQIEPYTRFGENNFILQKDGKKTVNIFFNPEGAKTGIYRGEIDVVIRRPKYSV